MKKYFIFALCAILSVGVITGCGTKKENKKAEENTENELVSQVNITGGIDFVKTVEIENYDSMSICGRYYYKINYDDKQVVFDSDGNELASSTYTSKDTFCFSDGTIVMFDDYETLGVWRNNNKIHTFVKNGVMSYDDKNGVLYYLDKDYSLVAYDTYNKKVLWTVNDMYYHATAVLDDVVIAYNSSNPSLWGAVIDKKTGNIIAKTTDDYVIYTSLGKYYVKTGNNLEYVEVYDYNSNLVSKQEFSTDDEYEYIQMFASGYYVLKNCNFKPCEKQLFNSNSELIMTDEESYYGKFYYNFGDYNTAYSLESSTVSPYRTSTWRNIPTLLLYENGDIVDYYSLDSDKSYALDLSIYKEGYIAEPKTFLLSSDEVDGDNIYLISYKNGKKILLGNKENINYNYSFQLNGGKYVMIKSNDGGYSFYDSDLNKLDYTPTKIYYASIYNEWVILSDSNENYYIVNILTGEENKLDIDSYPRTNRNGFVTTISENDIVKVNFYKFN